MVRILHTGDLHLGRDYSANKYGENIAERCKQARMEALEKVIECAGKEECDYLVIAGDVFDRHSKNSPDLIGEVCGKLSRCPCTVLVLPGNHDYYQGEGDSLWTQFRKESGDNTVLLCEARPYAEEKAVFYPCPCHDKTSGENALSWLKQENGRERALPCIGVAHGALERLSPPDNYYPMTFKELEALGMDAWLIGHTHIPYPEEESIKNCRIFNAGTHQQTDSSDRSPGSVFVIEIGDDRQILAHRVHTGVIHFAKKECSLSCGDSLKNALEEKIAELKNPKDTILNLIINGIALSNEFDGRKALYEAVRERLLYFDPIDTGLQREVTPDMIDEMTIDGTVENKLLKQYIDRPMLLNLAYDLIRECKGE